MGVLRARPVAVVALATGLLLFAMSGRYGYHRDELYFLACGRHLAWGYPDQPPFVPLLARLMSAVDPTSLVLLRLPSDLAVAGTVALTAAIAGELGADRRGQVLAAVSIAISSITLGSGHLLSTTTFQLTTWAALILVVMRAVRTSDRRLWLLGGVVAGVGLLDNDLVAFLAVAIGVGVLVAGPRRIFANPWLWVGVGIAVAFWSPYLLWQAHHGWPEITIGRAIAHGSSGTSAPRWQIPVQQLYLASPPLVPLWIAGLVRLFRDHTRRAFGIAWFVLLVMIVMSGGKPYYLALSFPLLLAAGAQPAIDWVGDSAAKQRSWTIALGVGFVIAAVITLPIVPVGVLHDTPIVDVNYDAGETVAWPTYTAEIGAVFDRDATAGRILLAGNYGEAGAIERYGGRYGMHVAYSGDNAFWLWGPPPADADSAVAVGFSLAELQRRFGSVRVATRLDNHLSVDDDEQGEPVYVCAGLKRPWSTLWPGLQSYG